MSQDQLKASAETGKLLILGCGMHIQKTSELQNTMMLLSDMYLEIQRKNHILF